MINIQAEIEAEQQLKQATYILLKDVIEQVKQANQTFSYQDIANVIYNKFKTAGGLRGYRLPEKYSDKGREPIDVFESDIFVALSCIRDCENIGASIEECWQGREYFYRYSLAREDVKKALNLTTDAGAFDCANNVIVAGLKNQIYALQYELTVAKKSADKFEQEIEQLKAEIESKDRIIDEPPQSKPKSGKADTTKNAFIKALLKIHYGDDVAENPRPHVYDPNSSAKSKDGVIQKDFDLHGLSDHLPTGQTLNNWVKSIEL